MILASPVIPRGWQLGRLDDVILRIEAGVSFKALDRPAEQGELGVVKVSCATWGDFRPGENKALLPGCDPGDCPRISKGDLLISRANTVELVCAAVIVEDDYPNLLLSDKTLRLVLRSDRVDPRFLLYALRTPTVRRHLESHATGTSGSMRNVSQQNMRTCPLPLPPLPEQRRIAVILDKADAIRRKRQEAIRLTDQFLRSAFLEMFGDPLVNPKAWPRVPIGDLFDEQRAGARCGPFGTALRKNDYVRHGVPVWGIDNVSPNRFVQEGSLFITPDKYAELTTYSVEPGDILISRAGTVGRMCVARPTSSPSIIGTNLIRVALDRQRIVPEYVTAIFTYFPMRVGGLRASSDEGGYSFMKTSTLATLAVPLPPVTFQRKYEELVARHERMRSRQLELISESDVLFHALVQRAFRGQL